MTGRSKLARLAGVVVLLLVCIVGYPLSSPKKHSAKLSWKASTSVVKGYNIYRATHARGPYSRINREVHPSTTWVDSNVGSGKTYYYVITAVDPSGVESRYSEEVVAVIPQDKH